MVGIPKSIKKAVIPAAGSGTRFYPLTRAQPKEMLPVLDKPVIHYVVEEAIKSGLDQILIIVGHGKDSIIDYFDKHPLDSKNGGFDIDNYPEIFFVRQREPKGLADSLKYAEKFTGDEPFIVLLGDTIYVSDTDETITSQMLNAYTKEQKQIVMLEQVPDNKVKDYGIISGRKIDNKLWKVDDVVEKPSLQEAPSNMGITGTYLLHPEIYDKIHSLKTGRNGEYQLSDALKSIAAEGNLMGYEIHGTRYDIGTKELWVKTFIEFARKDPRFKDLV